MRCCYNEDYNDHGSWVSQSGDSLSFSVSFMSEEIRSHCLWDTCRLTHGVPYCFSLSRLNRLFVTRLVRYDVKETEV